MCGCIAISIFLDVRENSHQAIKFTHTPFCRLSTRKIIADQLLSLWKKWIVDTDGNFDELANYSMLGACLLAEICEKDAIGDHIIQGGTFAPLDGMK